MAFKGADDKVRYRLRQGRARRSTAIGIGLWTQRGGSFLVIEWQFANGRYENLDALAAELVRKRVEVIVAASTPGIRAAQKATAEIPIVFVNAADPVAAGFVASMARPGGNITGVTTLGLDLLLKQFELLLKVVPKMTRAAHLIHPDNPMTPIWLKQIEPAAQQAGVRLFVPNARTPEDIERAFLAMQRERVDAAIIVNEAFLNQQKDQIGVLATTHRVAAIGSIPGFAEAGGLLSYAADSTEAYRRIATYVDKILKGARPGELPVEQPTQYQLTVNMRTAGLLGITIPQEILANADNVIQ